MKINGVKILSIRGCKNKTKQNNKQQTKKTKKQKSKQTNSQKQVFGKTIPNMSMTPHKDILNIAGVCKI